MTFNDRQQFHSLSGMRFLSDKVEGYDSLMTESSV